MSQLKIGIQTASLRLPLKKALHTARALGADAVEIDARTEVRPAELSQTGLRHLRKILDDLNLTVCAVGFRTRRGYDQPAELERRIEATKAAMKLAWDLGAKVVVNQVGRVPDESSGPAWDLLTAALADLGRWGDRVGAVLAAETGSESGPDLARLLAALPPGAVGANLDPGNLIVNSFSVVEAVEALGDRIVHVHAKDAVRDLARGRGVEVPLGRGTADFPLLAGMLEERGYRGYWTIEREQADDPAREIGLAVEYLRRL